MPIRITDPPDGERKPRGNRSLREAAYWSWMVRPGSRRDGGSDDREPETYEQYVARFVAEAEADEEKPLPGGREQVRLIAQRQQGDV